MTEKQIACVYLARRLWGITPSYDDLRSIAEMDMTEEECEKIAQRIVDMADKMREPLLRHLGRSGIEV